MTPAELERVREIIADNDRDTALALLELEFGPKPQHRPPKVSPERLQEMARPALAWYSRNHEKFSREYIALEATDEHGKVARDDDEASALKRFLRTDHECQRHLHAIDGRGRVRQAPP